MASYTTLPLRRGKNLFRVSKAWETRRVLRGDAPSLIEPQIASDFATAEHGTRGGIVRDRPACGATGSSIMLAG